MNILFIGGGNMAAAIIGGLIARNWPPASLQVVDVMPETLADLERRFGALPDPARDRQRINGAVEVFMRAYGR